MLNYFLDAPAANPEQMAAWLAALAEPNRLRIFNLLMQGVQCNCELGDNLQMSPNLISHHLSKLRRAGLVRATRDPLDARWIYFTVDPQALAQLHAALGAFFDPRRIQARTPACGPRTRTGAGAQNTGKGG